MNRRLLLVSCALAFAGATLFGRVRLATLPPAVAEAAPAPGDARIVLAGGCFWGLQGVYERVRGVRVVTAGYSGGAAATAHYDAVSTGTTGHAESVEIVYDPRRVSTRDLLAVFFRVAHDPTELDRQGPDEGTQYRSEIFYTTPAQRDAARTAIADLGRAHAFRAPIVTQLAPLRGFYPAEPYHQHYLDTHPENPYIVANDLPKVAALERLFPALVARR